MDHQAYLADFPNSLKRLNFPEFEVLDGGTTTRVEKIDPL